MAHETSMHATFIVESESFWIRARLWYCMCINDYCTVRKLNVNNSYTRIHSVLLPTNPVIFQIVYVSLGSLEMILSCFFKSLSGSFVDFLTSLLLWQMPCVSNSKINSTTHILIHSLLVTILMSLKFVSLSLFLTFNCHSHAYQCIPYLIIHY